MRYDDVFALLEDHPLQLIVIYLLGADVQDLDAIVLHEFGFAGGLIFIPIVMVPLWLTVTIILSFSTATILPWYSSAWIPQEQRSLADGEGRLDADAD